MTFGDWGTRPDPVRSPRGYDLWEIEHERIGAGIPIGPSDHNPHTPGEIPAIDIAVPLPAGTHVGPAELGLVMGSDGKAHACHAGYDGNTFGWTCACGAADEGYGTEDAATLATAEHLYDVDALVSDHLHVEA